MAVEKQCITYSECVFVASVKKYAMCIIHIILSFVSCMAVRYFSTLSHKWYDFRGKKLLKTKCVFCFSLRLSEIFLVLRKIQRDVVTNVYRSSCNALVILPEFNET